MVTSFQQIYDVAHSKVSHTIRHTTCKLGNPPISSQLYYLLVFFGQHDVVPILSKKTYLILPNLTIISYLYKIKDTKDN